jgi:hypothetical protein
MKYNAYYGMSLRKAYPLPRKLLMITPEQLAASGTEHGHQAALFCFFQINAASYPLTQWLFSSSNGFFSTSGQKGKEKAAGLKNGVPDICLPVVTGDGGATEGYSGLYIELKIPSKLGTKNGGCSDDQIKWLAFLSSQGYKVKVCYGWEDARDTIIQYLEG